MITDENNANQLHISTDGAETWQITRPVIGQYSKSALTVTETPSTGEYQPPGAS